MKRHSFLFLIAGLVLTVCTQAADKPHEIREGIPYYADGTTDAYVQEKCVLDIYQPDSKEGMPVIIWFHGGGLTSGKRYLPGELRKALTGLKLEVKAEVRFVEDGADTKVETRRTDDAKPRRRRRKKTAKS